MLDECFTEQMKEVVMSCSKTRPTLLFYATMTDQVEQLATVVLKLACHCVSQQASQGVSGQQQGLAIVRIGVVGLIRCGRLLPRT